MKFLFTYQYGKITQYEFSAFDWSVWDVLILND